MKIISLRNIDSEIESLQNRIDYYTEKKYKALSRVLPKSKGIKSDMVSGGHDSTHDALLEYAIEIEQIDDIILELQQEQQDLIKLKEKELKRLEKYDKSEQQVIYYKTSGKTWRDIGLMIDQRKIACSVRTAKRIWKKYNEKN